MANLFSSARRSKSFRAALLGAVAVAAVGGMTFEALPIASVPALAAATTPSAGPSSFADVVDRVKGAVVSVKVKVAETNVSYDGAAQPLPNAPKGGPLERFFHEFGGPGGEPFGGEDHVQPRMSMAQGSGFFISADGYIVTNNHVVEHAKEVTVTMADGKSIAGQASSARTRRPISRCSRSRARTFPSFRSPPRRRGSAIG